MTDKETEIQHKLDAADGVVEAGKDLMQDTFSMPSYLAIAIDIATFGLGAWMILNYSLLLQLIGAILIMYSTADYIRAVGT